MFVEPANPDEVFELRRNTQTPVRVIDIQFGNFEEALTIVPFDRYLVNTLIVTFVGMAGHALLVLAGCLWLLAFSGAGA